MHTTSTVDRWAFYHPDLLGPLVVDAPCIPGRSLEHRARNLFYRLMVPLLREGVEDFSGGYLFPLASFVSLDEAETTPVDEAELADICETVMEETARWESPNMAGVFHVPDFIGGGAA